MPAPMLSIHLDGTNDHVTVIDHANFDMTTNCAIGAWICRDMDAPTAIEYILDRQNAYSLYLDTAGRVSFYIAGVGTITSKRKIKLEKPTFVMGHTYPNAAADGYVLEIWIDDVLDSQRDVYGGDLTIAVATGLYIGTDNSTTYYFHGSIAQLFLTSYRIYPNAVQAIVASTTGETGVYLETLGNVIVAHYPFDGDSNQGCGDAANGVDVNAPTHKAYMHLLQSMNAVAGAPPSRVMYLANDETGYRMSAKISPTRLTWTGDEITDGNELLITDRNGNEVFSYISVLDDQGGTWYFGPDAIWKGLAINTLTYGTLEIEIR